jgi:hypothetical protein
MDGANRADIMRRSVGGVPMRKRMRKKSRLREQKKKNGQEGAERSHFAEQKKASKKYMFQSMP